MVRHHACVTLAIATVIVTIGTVAILSDVKQMVCGDGRIGFWILTLDIVSRKAFH